MKLKGTASASARRSRIDRMSNTPISSSTDHQQAVSEDNTLSKFPIANMFLTTSTINNCARVPSPSCETSSIPEVDPRTIRWKYDEISHSSLSQSQNSCSSSDKPTNKVWERNRSNFDRTNVNLCDSSFDNYDMNLGFSLISPNYTNHVSSKCSHILITNWHNDFLVELWRFMVRLAGRCLGRRFLTSTGGSQWIMSSSFLCTFVAVTACLFIQVTDACSSRSTPKPRPPSPTLRPNITIQTYTCPPEYDAHYCLNGASCFTVKIGDSLLYNCECSEGYMGQRCEFKDLDGSYLPSKQRAMLEQAGITSGVVIIIILVVIICSYLYVRSRRKPQPRNENEIKCAPTDATDHIDPNYRLVLPEGCKEKRPFSTSCIKPRDC